MTSSATTTVSRALSGVSVFGDRSAALRLALLCGVGIALSGCGTQDRLATQNGPVDRYNQRLGVASSPRVVEEGQPVPRGGGVYRVGRPYTVAGRRYVPFEKPEGHAEVGVASWYGRQFHGRLTANGEAYDMHGLSAAHRTMPMPSYARVTNMRNGHSVIVRVNDRGPFHANRVIDLSSRTAHLLDFRGHGVARVKVEYVGRAPLEGSDDRVLMATLRTDGSAAPRPANLSNTMIASAEPRFVPRGPAQPAIVETAQPVSPLAGGMPLPPERPFDLGLAQPTSTTTVARQQVPAQVMTTQVAVSQPPAVTTRTSGSSTVTVTTAAAPAAVAAPAAPSLASASSRPVTLPTSTAYAPAPAQAPALAAMPGAPAPRAAFGAGSLY
ncbi:septal ring lytic transglycosylase RlpA family protein [Phreatobacter aquaticus]|uniref:septal ring lytic transglycosylase RlpA family protein n=1 Tax=Phreatobacter aquaticus TaxID=2570229 RepID=UPI0026956BBB